MRPQPQPKTVVAYEVTMKQPWVSATAQACPFGPFGQWPVKNWAARPHSGTKSAELVADFVVAEPHWNLVVAERRRPLQLLRRVG